MPRQGRIQTGAGVRQLQRLIGKGKNIIIFTLQKLPYSTRITYRLGKSGQVKI